MSHTPLETVVAPEVKVVMPAPVLEAVPDAACPPRPTAEQLRALDGAFADQQRESGSAAGLIGLWSGGMLLRDLALDAAASEQEEEPDKKPGATGDQPADA
jgi:hypothetical protein